MSTVVKIVASGLPSIYPVNYNDTSFYDEDINRRYQLSDIKDPEILTEWDGVPRIKVQTVFYSAYKISILTQSPLRSGFEKMAKAKNVEITFEDGTTHNADILEINEIEGVEWLYITEITYKDLDSKVIVNYHDFTTDENMWDGLYSFTLKNSKIIDTAFQSIVDATDYDKTYKTNFALIDDIDKIDEKGSDDTGVFIGSRFITKKYKQVRLILNEDEKNEIKRYAPQCNQCYATSQTTTYEQVERVEVDDSAVGEGWYIVTVKLVYNVVSYNTFN